MNSLMFLVDINDYILKCIYYENFGVGSRKEIVINLPDSRLHNIFFDMIKNNPKTEPIVQKSINIFNFYDVDVDMIDKLIEESKNQQKSILFESKKETSVPIKTFAEQKQTAFKSTKPASESQKCIKVKRTNKFKKTFIKTSASVLVALSIFMVSKDVIKNMDFTRESFNLSDSENFEVKDTAIEKMKDTETKIISFKDDTLDKIDTFRDIVGWNDSKETKSFDEKEAVQSQNIEIPVESIVSDQKEIIKENISAENSIVPDQYLRICAEDLIDSEKHNISKAYYSESLSKYAKRYGIDPTLALAVGTHERGIHNDQVDIGGAVGLFQIQIEGGWNWDNKTITAYNFETNQYEDVLITKDSVSDVFMNMQVGCMMLQNLLVSYNYNVAEAVTAYNYGTENVRYVLETCSKSTGLSIDELNSINNTDWLKYRDIIKGGDPEYLENVFKYIPNGTILSFTKPNNEKVNVKFDNLSYQENKII